MSPSPDSPEGHHHGQPGGKIPIDHIDHLPNEILMDIFERVLQMSRKDVPFEESMRYLWFHGDYPKDIPPEESMLAPLRLSQVSRLWRSLALSYPSLWTDITVLIYKFDSTQRDEWFLNVVDTWLSRSGVSPLRLRVECDTSCLAMRGYPLDEADDVPGPKSEITAHILRKVLDHQNRWRDASFTFIGRDPRMLPQLGLVDVPLLESLSIYWEGLTQHHAMAQMNLDISCSPRLRSLHLVGIPRIITGALSNLRELTLVSVSASLEIDIRQSILLEILQSVPNLQVLDIRAIHCKSDNPQSSFITLPGLHTLAVDDFGHSAFIINRLVLPGLKRLICNPFYPDGQEFSEMLVRSRPALEYFETPGFVVNGDDFSRFLRLMPGLKTLCMVGVSLVPDLLEMLSVKETAESWDIGSILCPNLEELCFKKCRYWYIDFPERISRSVESLCNMLQKRCHALGQAGTIECYSEYYTYDEKKPDSLDENPPSNKVLVCITENRLFDIPFVDIGCAGMRETLANHARMDIRFEKLLATEG